MIYNAIQLVEHEHCMHVRRVMNADVCECEIGLVLLDRYLSSAFHNGHLSFENIRLLTRQVKLSWVLCLMISIKFHNDYHKLPSFYAHQLNIPMDVLVSNEVNVLMYLLRFSKVYVDAEDIVTMRRRNGNRTLTMFGIPIPSQYTSATFHGTNTNTTPPSSTFHKKNQTNTSQIPRSSCSHCSDHTPLSPHMIVVPLNWLKTFSLQFCELSIWKWLKNN